MGKSTLLEIAEPLLPVAGTSPQPLVQQDVQEVQQTAGIVTCTSHYCTYLTKLILLYIVYVPSALSIIARISSSNSRTPASHANRNIIRSLVPSMDSPNSLKQRLFYLSLYSMAISLSFMHSSLS